MIGSVPENPWDADPGSNPLIEAARKLVGPAEPRNHHVVPRFYLNRWADESGMIRLTNVTEGPRRTKFCSAKTSMRIRDFYRLESPDIDPSDLPTALFELMLGRLEQPASEAIDVLAAGDVVTPDLKSDLSWFMGFQYVRGKAFRSDSEFLAHQSARIMLSGINDEGIRARLRRSGVEDTEDEIRRARAFLDDVESESVRITPQKPEFINQAGQMGIILGSILMQREWQVISTCAPLITSDEPVIVIGGPGTSRRRNAGFGRAAVITFPLDPWHLLAMFHPMMDTDPQGDLLPTEVSELNAELAASASTWLVESPARSLTTFAAVPAFSPSPALKRFRPIGEEGRELIHFFGQSPWYLAPAPPPWPVKRWWTLQHPGHELPQIEPYPEIVELIDASWDDRQGR
jgi:hypothetical protein